MILLRILFVRRGLSEVGERNESLIGFALDLPGGHLEVVILLFSWMLYSSSLSGLSCPTGLWTL
jgi:hypothetical protein